MLLDHAQKLLSTSFPWMIEYRFRRSLLDDDAFIHEYNAVGYLASKSDLVCYHQHCHAFFR